MTHSPEPWSLTHGGVASAQDANGHRLESDPYDGVEAEDWERIVACVNACAGVDSKVLVERRQEISKSLQSYAEVMGRIDDETT